MAEEYIKKSSLIKSITEGLNSGRFGHDAVEILADIECVFSDEDTLKLVRCYKCTYFRVEDCFCPLKQHYTSPYGFCSSSIEDNRRV